MLVGAPGQHADHVLLNVVRSKGPGRVRDAVLIDNLETKVHDFDNNNVDSGAHASKFYAAEDLDTGATINVCGRDMMLYDCDEATRDFYATAMNKGKNLDSTYGI